MLVQNSGSDRDQHTATDDLRTLSREIAKDAAEHDAERYHHQCREADHQRNDTDSIDTRIAREGEDITLSPPGMTVPVSALLGPQPAMDAEALS